MHRVNRRNRRKIVKTIPRFQMSRNMEFQGNSKAVRRRDSRIGSRLRKNNPKFINKRSEKSISDSHDEGVAVDLTVEDPTQRVVMDVIGLTSTGPRPG
jgi:hypothetical protein